MLIDINVNLPGPSQRPLPPQLVQFGTEELVLIELQGALEVEGNKDGQLVGKLRVDPNTKKPTMMIGHHLLEGKLVNLAKPLAVLHKHDSPPGMEDEAAMEVEDDSPRPPAPQAKSWDIVAVVKKKMVFSKRPMPVVGSGTGKASSAAPLSRIGSKAG
ncbi:Ctf8-domain-containing protein [Cerioporus squamosus]|nr:Ctf8-domain-containing protein [Cerioporus squamosus]